MADIEVIDNPQDHRYEARVAGELAGFARYELTEELIAFVHSEVDPAFEGRGVGGTIVRSSLDDVRAKGGRQVRALCPFYKAWIARHEDYQDLLYAAAPGSI